MENILEAKECYILMKKEYRISRNIRAEWYLNRINSHITISRKKNVKDFHGELEVVSVLPFDPPPDWDSDTAHEYKYLVTERTQLYFLSQKYRLVLCLDLSPSLSVVNIEKGKVVFEEIFPTLEQCLKGVVRPFVVPGSQLLLFPKIYITIIAHTPFFKSQPQQVIVQGWLLVNERENLQAFLRNVNLRIIQIQNQLAKLTGEVYSQIERVGEIGHIEDDCGDFSNLSTIGYDSQASAHPMVSPDIGFVNMLRYGIVALQLLPQNSMAGIIVITDGVISLPDATMFDALLVQLRNLTISCSFLQIGGTFQPHVGLGYVPFNDLMLFLANATCGVYFNELPEIDGGYDNEMNVYHKAFLTWGFQKDLEENRESPVHSESLMTKNAFASETSLHIRKRERKGVLAGPLNAVLSCRLREGYVIKNVKLTADRIELILLLSWKYTISIEYHIHSIWPPTKSEVQTEVWTEGSYEFLNDVSNMESNVGSRSQYRQRMVAKYRNTLQDLRETDLLLVKLQSFPSNPLYYTIPDCVQKGIPVFYMNSLSSNPVPSSDFHVQYPQFANFWLPICMLNINKWQKWMHTHRIGVILKHETPLPKNLHVMNNSGRYGTVHSRHSELTLTSFLANWTDFILIENNSYIKYLYSDKSPTPSSFFVVRITSNRPPCLAIRIAFLGGTSCRIRSKIVEELQENIQQLAVRVRERSRERKSTDVSTKSSVEEREQSMNSVICCSITHKPIEKILIWQDRIPSNLFSSQVQQTTTSYYHSSSGRLGETNKFASENQALLCRYLHHRRWIWGTQSASALSVPMNALMRVLDTLTRMRLQEGFRFAYSRNGIVTMIKEFGMKLDLHYHFGGSDRHLDQSDVTSYCMVQYIMFPVHSFGPKESLEDDADEGDSVETDGESQLITECWVEPQNGVVQGESDKSDFAKGLNYRQLASSFFDRDKDCIWALLTFEYLSQFCQDENDQNVEYVEPTNGDSLPGVPPTDGPHEAAIQQIPFQFQLSHLLPRCQRTEILLSTLIQDLYGHITNSFIDKNLDRANHLLYSLILGHLSQLHDGKQFHLSACDNARLPQVLSERIREEQHGISPFAETEYQNASEAPKWRCFIKYISPKHFLITVIPSSFCDLQRLLLHRDNILNEESKAVQIVDQVDCLELIKDQSVTEGAFPSDITEEDINMSNYSEYTSSPITQRAKSTLSSCQRHSLASTGSNISSRSSSIPQDKISLMQSQTSSTPVEKSGAHKHPNSETSASKPSPGSDYTKKSDDLKRQRYRSGPSTSCNLSYPMESVVESAENRRGRAYSLHSSNEGSAPQLPSRSSVSTFSSSDKSTNSVSKERKDSSWTQIDTEKLRKRNISLPSKCHTDILNKSINSKSFSAEMVKEDASVIDSQTALCGDAEISFQSSSMDSNFHVPPHDPVHGSVTLPVYCFDCKLSCIVDQYLNKLIPSSDTRKDIYIDSTFKIGEDTLQVTERNGSYQGISTSHEAADKTTSPEPLSEESDTLSSDVKCLKKFTESIEKCHRRSFVMGCFEALSNELFVHAFDVQAALDQCHEAFLETDVTDYLQMICGHLKDFRIRYFMKQKESDKRFGLGSHFSASGTQSNRFEYAISEKFPLSLLFEHHACQHLISVQNEVRNKFSEIIQAQFKPVPNLQDYYYFSPLTVNYSQEENNKYKFWKQTRKIKKKSEDYFGDLYEKEEEGLEGSSPQNGAANESLLDEDDFDKSIEFRSDGGSFVSHPRIFTQFSQISQISEMSGLSMVDDNENKEDGLQNPSFPPLFVHLTCTIRYEGQVIGSSSIRSIPTCLGDLTSNFTMDSLDLSKLSVSLELLVMTLLGGAEVLGEELRLSEVDTFKRRGRRTISGCSNASSALRLSESTLASNSGSEDMCLHEDDVLYKIPENQHKAIVITFEKINWLMEDHIVSALLQCYPITPETLQLAASHVIRSYPAPNCLLESVPLKFVFGVEQSMGKFMEEFKNLKIGRYHLEKVGDFYFLAVPHDYYRRRRLCSVVPPLPFSRKSSLTMQLSRQASRESSSGMGRKNDFSDESLSRPNSRDGESSTPKKTQKVSFDPNLNDSKEKSAESPGGTESKKGVKWARRRRRKERRDSEKRGALDSSDSEEDISPPTQISKDTETLEIIDSRKDSRRPSLDQFHCSVEKQEEETAEVALLSENLPVDTKGSGPDVVGETVPKDDVRKEVEEGIKAIQDTSTAVPEDGNSKDVKAIQDTSTAVPEDGNSKDVKGVVKAIQDTSTVVPEDGNRKDIEEVAKVIQDDGFASVGDQASLSPHKDLVRCGSVSLPQTEKTKSEGLRKSASIEDFSHDKSAKDDLISSALLGDILRQKYGPDPMKIRHNSGGESFLKSRHNSGMGSNLALCSDVSSHLESEQTTEDGCEGDISGSDECMDWMQDFDIAPPPEFWVVVKIASDIQTYFHCRNEQEFEHWKYIHEEVVQALKNQVKVVNQQLLLQDLNNCRMCNHLLEPETPDDIWKQDDSKDADSESSDYLEAALTFQLGAFACPRVWFKEFELHPRLKFSGKGVIKGIHTLKKTLSPFMVNNRKNMFVYEDSSGVGTNVFYLRLHEQQGGQMFSSSLSVEGTRRVGDSGEVSSRGPSITSALAKKGTFSRDEENLTPQTDTRRLCLDKDVIVEGVPSALPRKGLDHIVLSVHGIAEPGVAIKENLVQMLQKRLDDSVLDAICLMLWDNPHHKLTPEDVHFIQPPYQPPTVVLRFSVNPFALPYIQALCCYLKQNLIASGFNSAKYTDNRTESHFQDFSASEQEDPVSDSNVFLFVCSQKSGTKGVACVAFSVVDDAGNRLPLNGPPKFTGKAYEEIRSESEFEGMVSSHPASSDDIGALTMFQFKVWECGRLDFKEISRCLEDAIRHSLWDLNMEHRFLLAPITPSCLTPGVPSLPSTPIKTASGKAFGSPRSSYHSQDKLGSPLFFNQPPGRGRALKNRRSSIQVLMDYKALTEMVPKPASKSPTKPRLSVDLGHRDHPTKPDVKLPKQLSIPQDSLVGESDAAFVEAESPSSQESLQFVYANLMSKWLEVAVKQTVPSVKKHVVSCATTSALPALVVDIQRWLQIHVPETVTLLFKRSSDNTYIKEDFQKIHHVMRQEKGAGSHLDFVITNRNERHWWAILFEKDILEVTNQMNKANKSMKFGSVCITQHCSSEPQTADVTSNTGYFSSPTSSVVMPFSESAPTPSYTAHGTFKFPDVHLAPVFIHRQMFFFAALKGNEFSVYTYNWPKDTTEMLHCHLNRLSQWTVARMKLLSSLVLQKMGLFQNQPFVRKDVDQREEATKKEGERKEESNPFVQNLHYIEGLIKSVSPGRDSLGPNERSGRRAQSQTSLQNLSEVLRDSVPPRPLQKQQPKKDLLQRHGIQMIEVTRISIHKEKERKILNSTVKSEVASTPVFSDLTLNVFKKHARLVHFCLTPILFLPKWRSEVATVRDHSLPASSSSSLESTSQSKIIESRSRHESGASTKGTIGPSHLEVRRSSSVGVSSSCSSSPTHTHTRKRHPTLGGEDKWHDALCLSYLKEFIQYLHCLGFVSVCVPQSSSAQQEGKQIHRSGSQTGSIGGRGREETWRGDIKMTDQDISSPTYLARQCFGGTLLLQINFAEPYFSTLVYSLEAARTQFPKCRSKSQQCRNFIEEAMLMKSLLHMHSFTYDYHLRAVYVYVANRQLLFARGYHLSSFLSDFIKYYNKGPNFARNLIFSGEVRIEETGSSGEQLYNYLLSREKEYGMRVLRMTPVVVDSSEMNTEFVLVHTKESPAVATVEGEEGGSRAYDVTLLISHDTSSGPDAELTKSLDLKFYVILTSRRWGDCALHVCSSHYRSPLERERVLTVSDVLRWFDENDQPESDMYPNRNSEPKFGRFRTVSTKMVTKGGGSTGSRSSETSSVSRADFGEADASRKTSLSSSSQHLGIRQESVNYLGFYSAYEIDMENLLRRQVDEARGRILEVFNAAKIHCRRDFLWQRLIWDEEKMKSSRDQTGSSLSFGEFCELLSLVIVKSVSLLDPQLIPLVSQPIHWYQSLARLLANKYQDSISYGTRFLTSTDANVQYVVVYSHASPDSFMLITYNLHTQRADISCVCKSTDSDTLDPKVRPFFVDFVNCCCFHLWSGLV